MTPLPIPVVTPPFLRFGAVAYLYQRHWGVDARKALEPKRLARRVAGSFAKLSEFLRRTD